MRLTLFILFCTVTLTASAQFWQKKQKEETRFPQLEEANYISATAISPATKINTDNVQAVVLKRSNYNIELAEDIIMREAKHNMRFREYNTASYNFTDLAHLYILQHRFSEAKWFLLQSNLISRERNDDKHTIANLLDLAGIKASIGELALARADLKEAHEIATLKGLTADLATVDSKTKEIELSTNPVFSKSQFRYASAVEADAKAKNK